MSRLIAVTRMALLLVFAAAASACAGGRSGPALGAAQRMEAARAACGGVPDSDVAPGFEGLEVVRPGLLARPIGSRYYVEGAEIVVELGERTFPDMARLVACRTASALASDDRDDPLGVPGAIVRVVHEVDHRVIVQVRSRRAETVREIARRARRAFPKDELIAPTYERDFGMGPGAPHRGAHARPDGAPVKSAPRAGPSRGGGSLFLPRPLD